MSSSEVSVSCCLSLSSIILDVGLESSFEDKANGKCDGASEDSPKTENVENGSEEKSEKFQEDKTKSPDIDDEDRELIIKLVFLLIWFNVNRF